MISLQTFVLILGLVLFFVFLLVLSLLYTTTRQEDTTDLNYSESRLQKLNRVLKSHLGSKWPVIFIIFAILLIIIGVILYLNTKKPITVSISDQGGKNLTIISLIIVCLVAVITVVLFLNYYLKENPEDTYQQKQDKKNFVTNIGLIIAIVFVLTFGYMYFFNRK